MGADGEEVTAGIGDRSLYHLKNENADPVEQRRPPVRRPAAGERARASSRRGGRIGLGVLRIACGGRAGGRRGTHTGRGRPILFPAYPTSSRLPVRPRPISPSPANPGTKYDEQRPGQPPASPDLSGPVEGRGGAMRT